MNCPAGAREATLGCAPPAVSREFPRTWLAGLGPAPTRRTGPFLYLRRGGCPHPPEPSPLGEGAERSEADGVRRGGTPGPPGNGPMRASGPTKDRTHLRIHRRGGCPHPPATFPFRGRCRVQRGGWGSQGRHTWAASAFMRQTGARFSTVHPWIVESERGT